ncbi:MarR family winged helix-turn-helix transcriptional regulator [Patulibacter minatonensis]|uniref:MarR family winged helix-turn-helix transcriptional regulator n=1 Tax=Patulibacter minatonensis TaxID=298163 RepID=UPI00047D543E|nr:MarR family transcriptional regulator [Patulibacter minatonensis]
MAAPETDTETRLLDARELASWRGMLRSYVLLQRDLEQGLDERHGLQHSTYEVLMHLSDAPDGRMRLSDLAKLAVLSRSGLTRLIDRLENDGQVVRERCATDARGYFAVLTEEGRERVDAARGEYLDEVRKRFHDLLSPEEQAVLGDVWTKVLDNLEPGLKP